MNAPTTVLVTGSNGFIGKNLLVRLGELDFYKILQFDRGGTHEELQQLIRNSDVVVHLAGENRPKNTDEFKKVNTDLTKVLCDVIEMEKRNVPLIFASSSQAALDNPYGQSKRLAEEAIAQLVEKTENSVVIFRLPGVFGKWCRPNYNSVVATFCSNIANDKPIHIDDSGGKLKLVYIDDVIESFVSAIAASQRGLTRIEVQPVYECTVQELATQIEKFKKSRHSLVSERVGAGFIRALYSTYISYLPQKKFVYDLEKHEDARGVFVEMLKTQDSGQFSFFSAYPGVTRGSHYHHSKTEKFLVLEGRAKFRFRHLVTQERCEILTSGDVPQIVETIPGWTHDITNIGDQVMIVMLWANEIFDSRRPDTFACKV